MLLSETSVSLMLADGHVIQSRHGRQSSWDWHHLTSMRHHTTSTSTGTAPCPEGWWRLEGCPDLDDSIFKEFLQQGGQSSQASPTPAS